MPDFSRFEEEYWSARRLCGLCTSPTAFISLRGPEGLDFLNRLSTNDVLRRHDSGFAQTVLTTEKGRIVDILTLIPRTHQDLLLAAESGEAARVIDWLSKFIIMEDLQLTDLSGAYSMVYLIGDEAESIAAKVVGATPPTSGITTFEVGKGYGWVFRDPRWLSPAFRCTVPSGGLSAFLDAADSNACTRLSAPVFESIRIENGVPAMGKELTGQVNPLEAGLQRLVSFTKGCYIGQEVIARTDTYKKLRRQLRGFSAEVSPDVPLCPGNLIHKEEECGWTTSYSWSPFLGKQLALGYLNEGSGSGDLELHTANGVVPIRLESLPMVIQSGHPVHSRPRGGVQRGNR